MDLEIRGAEEFGIAARRLRAAGTAGKGLRKELYAGIQRATKPAKTKVKASALHTLPARGGLAGVISRSKVRTRTRSGRWPGVRIVGAHEHDINAMNRGRLRHPVFGNRGRWRTQSVPKGWFTDPLEDMAPELRRELLTGIRNVAKKIERG